MRPHPLRRHRRAQALSAALALAASAALGQPPPQTPALDPSRHAPTHKAERIHADLAAAPEVSLQSRGEKTVLYKTRPADDCEDHPVLAEFDRRADLAGMPVLRGDACRASPADALRIGNNSRALRNLYGDLFWDKAGNEPRRAKVNDLKTYFHDTDVGLVLQMLQCETNGYRKYLVGRLREIGSPAASKALAQRAVFETDTALRHAAVEALKARSTAPAKQVLLDGLQHPYAAFADFAAEAIIALKAKELKNALVDLLEKPSPAAPYIGPDGKAVVREVVRVNHARNCQLCHAPSYQRSDVARVGVPRQDQPLPSSFSVQYYEPEGDRAFVTAGVTYLRQDFSLTLAEANAAPWPERQRYDFFVRNRPAEPWEVATIGGRKPSPQLYATLRALRSVTGQDHGYLAEDWRKRLK